MLGLIATLFCVWWLRTYGLVLFVFGPFVMGWISASLYGYHAWRPYKSTIGVASLSILVLVTLLILVGGEGAICLIMSLPLAIPIAILGATIGHERQTRQPKDQAKKIIPLFIILMPLLMGAEYAVQPQPKVLPVKSYVDIDAPVEVVWKNVIAFPALPEPKGGIFSTGIAYPKYASIKGTGVGAVRECHFSTGAFIEPVTVWDENKLLRFDVTSQPAPMKELSPYGDIHTPHMDNYLQSKQGQFLLTQLPDGKIRLEGTTWYSNKMWPETYWRVWSDYIIQEIHLRVLEHIKTISEELVVMK